MRIKTILTIAVLLTLSAGASSNELSASLLKEGDIIYQTSRSSQSLAIQRATGSRYSHMGMIIYRNGAPMVFEAVQTVRYTPLKEWIAGEKADIT
jgi:hypothetical protein